MFVPKLVYIPWIAAGKEHGQVGMEAVSYIAQALFRTHEFSALVGTRCGVHPAYIKALFILSFLLTELVAGRGRCLCIQTHQLPSSAPRVLERDVFTTPQFEWFPRQLNMRQHRAPRSLTRIQPRKVSTVTDAVHELQPRCFEVE